MSPVVWMLIGAGAFLALSVVLVSIVEGNVRESLRDVACFLLAIACAPGVAVAVLCRRSDVQSRKIDPRTLARFARMRTADDPELWAFTFFYGRRGLIWVRRANDRKEEMLDG